MVKARIQWDCFIHPTSETLEIQNNFVSSESELMRSWKLLQGTCVAWSFLWYALKLCRSREVYGKIVGGKWWCEPYDPCSPFEVYCWAGLHCVCSLPNWLMLQSFLNSACSPWTSCSAHSSPHLAKSLSWDLRLQLSGPYDKKHLVGILIKVLNGAM